MRFATISAAALAFAVSAIAQTAGFDPISNPLNNEKVPAGSKYTIKWQPGSVKGNVKIALIGGATQNTQEPISTIKAGVDNQAGSYEWDVPATLGDKAVYGLTITLESDPATFQYSFPFHITPKEGSSSKEEGGYPVSGKPTVTVSLSKGVSSTTAAATASGTATGSSSGSSKAAPTASSAASYSGMPKPSSNGTATYSAGNSASTTMATVTGGSGGSQPTTSAPATVPTAGASRMASGSAFAVGAVAAFFFF